MPKPELTKKLLADTLKKLSLRKHIDKISISEIVEEAGLNRQTFYYHFRDKQELICWIFDTDMASLTDKNHNNTLIDDIVVHIYSERSFYIAALTSEAQNNLREHLYSSCYNRCMEELSFLHESNAIDDETMVLFVRFFTHAVVGILVEWAQGGMQLDSTQFLEAYAPVLTELLLTVMKSYANEK